MCEGKYVCGSEDRLAGNVGGGSGGGGGGGGLFTQSYLQHKICSATEREAGLPALLGG
jgi:hypothetical protein